MKSTRINYNLLAVSGGAAETALNTFQTLDMSLMVTESDYLALEPRRETNENELNGMEEADRIDARGGTSKLSMNFEKLQPHQAAFLLAFGLGDITTTAAGTGYQHEITPIDGEYAADRSNPTFTAAQRLGKTIDKRRCAGMAINNLSLTFAADDWLQAKAEVVGTGKYEESVGEETVSELDNAVSITLDANGVEGATAEERLANVHLVRAKIDGAWQFANVTAVSGDVPAVITIDSLGGAGATVDYQVLYVPVEPAWCSFPAKIVETPLLVSGLQMNLGGAWDGTQFVGGKRITADFQSLEYSLNNNIDVMWGLGSGDYANRIWRQNRFQKISFDRELRDWLLQNYLANNETFGIRLLCEGAEYEAGHKYGLELIFPKCGLLASPISAKNKQLAETGDLQVLQDANYGSVIGRVKNLVSGFAA